MVVSLIILNCLCESTAKKNLGWIPPFLKTIDQFKVTFLSQILEIVSKQFLQQVGGRKGGVLE